MTLIEETERSEPEVQRDAPAEAQPVELAPAPADPGAFALLYREQFGRMARLAFLLIGSRDDARDVVQDAFVGLHRRFDRVDDPVAYLRRSVVNGCNSHHRRRARRAKQFLAADDTVELGARELLDALSALPERQRAAIVLRYFHDLPETEIAVVLGCRPGTVGSLLHRGVARLREVIER